MDTTGLILRRDDQAEIMTKHALRKAKRQSKGEDRVLVASVLENDDKVAIVVDAITTQCRALATSDHPLLDAILAFIKDLIEHPEKLINLIKTLAPLFVMV